MMEKQLKKYLQLNKIAQEGETVFFGSTFLAEMNFGEFAQRFNCIYKIYNRSFLNLKTGDAAALYAQCVKDLNPRNLFLGLGEEDEDDFKDDYVALIKGIKEDLPKCKIHLLSVFGDPKEVEGRNQQIKEASVEAGVEYIDVMCELLEDDGSLIEGCFDQDGEPAIEARIALWRRIVYPMRSGYEAYGDGIGLVSSINMIS